MWEKLCNIGKPPVPTKTEGTYSGPDTFKAQDYLIQLVNPGKIKIMRASLID
jgi:hypothetical protein